VISRVLDVWVDVADVERRKRHVVGAVVNLALLNSPIIFLGALYFLIDGRVIPHRWTCEW